MSSRKKEVEGLPKIKEISTFQGKSEALRAHSSPSMSLPPPACRPMAPPPIKDLSDSCIPLTITESTCAIAISRLDLACGVNGVSYAIIAAIQRANPKLLPTLFSNIHRYGTFQRAWKLSMCIPIPKPNRTDTINLEHLRAR